MTKDQLCALALAAIDDETARVVLDDAMLESAWWDERFWTAAGWPWAASIWPGQEAFMSNAAWLTGMGQRAVAAVLLFGDWPTSWPLASGCVRVETDAELRARLLGYWSPWTRSIIVETDITTATGTALDTIAQNVYGLPRR